MFYVSGINKYNIGNNYKTIHAEEDAIRKLKYSKVRCKVEILVFRTNKMGNKLMNSKPCENCIKCIMRNIALKNYNVSKIYYTNDDGEIEFMKTKDL